MKGGCDAGVQGDERLGSPKALAIETTSYLEGKRKDAQKKKICYWT